MKIKALLFLFLILGVPSLAWAGASRDFDGSGDHVDFGYISQINGATNLSVLAWQLNETLINDNMIVSDNNTANFGFEFFMDENTVNDRFQIVIADGTDSIAPTFTNGTALQNTWQCLSFSFTAATTNGLHFYVTFAEDAASPVNTTTVDNLGNDLDDQVRFGSSVRTGRDHDGQITYGQIWSRALAAWELTEAGWNPGIITTNLELFAPIWGSASPEVDLSGKGHSGTVTNTTASATGPPVFQGMGMPL